MLVSFCPYPHTQGRGHDDLDEIFSLALMLPTPFLIFLDTTDRFIEIFILSNHSNLIALIHFFYSN
jgi:hypothetical protein